MKKTLLTIFLMMVYSLGFSQSAAPTPPARNASDVISIFSGAYTDIAGTDFNPGWGQSTVASTVTFGGDVARSYTNFNYQGYQFATPLNPAAASMTSLHLDVYSVNCTTLKIFMIIPGQPERSVNVTPTLNAWKSVDIPLTSFGNPVNNNVIQFKWESVPFGGTTVYLDNIYFWKSAATPSITGFSIPEQVLGAAPFTITQPTSTSPGAFTYTSGNQSVATISGNTVTIVGVGTSTITANQAAGGGFDAGQAATQLVVGYAPPTTNAPTPTDPAGNVISIFSDAYTNMSGTDFFPNWGQSTTVSNITIAGNTIKKYSNFNYEGTNLGSTINAPAAGMTRMHLDVWSPDCTSLSIFPITGGAEQAKTVTLALNTWNSIDIDLAHFTNLNLANIYQIKMQREPHPTAPTKTIYLDNIYFSSASVQVEPTLSNFVVPTKGADAASFTITPPTSTSSGAFTYESSDHNVATVSGNMITIVGIGTTVITATQAATGLYTSGTITANFVVTTPVPTITNFTIPAKLLGDPDFSLNPPSSNSGGLFTYSSSNNNVATISGDTVTLVGEGTSVITATQAADGIYGIGTITANLVVGPAMTAAPTPPARAAANVISIFSNAYTDRVGTVFNQFQGGAQSTTLTDVQVAGNDTKRYQNFNYTGIAFGPPLDAHLMTNMHFDVWTSNCTSLRIYFIVGGVPAFKDFTPTLNGWKSFDFLLSTLGYSASQLSSLQVLKLEAQPFGSSDVYMDNMYFWKSETSPTLSNFSVPAKFVGDADFTLTAPTSTSPGTFSYTSSNQSVATINGDVVTIVGAGTSIITAIQAASGQYESASITANLVVTVALTTPAPTPPARLPANVVSVFSGAYTNVVGTVFNQFQGGVQTTTLSTPQIAGDSVNHYENFNVTGIAFAAPFLDVHYMTTMHLDVWSTNCNSLRFYFIVGGVPNYKDFAITHDQWNSFDFSLASLGYSAAQLSTLQLLKLEAQPFGSSDVYIDNLYFWKPDTTPTFGPFTIPAKVVGDAAFELTAPTSTSTGEFTYTSSNESVATISGSTVTIVGGGTSTITATQAAAAPYESATVTAQLVVSFAPPMTAAPTPTVDPAHVLSIFSNAYTNRAGTDFFPNWGQSTTVSQVQIAGNTTLKYSNLNYQGTVFAAPFINATAMKRLHIDIYTPDCTELQFFPIVQGQPEQSVTLHPTLAQWNSFDIDLSQYTIPLDNIFQFKIVGTTGSTVYIDNIFFSDILCDSLTTFYVDSDGDGYDNGSVEMCVIEPGYSATTKGTDCNDGDSSVYRIGNFYVDADNDTFYDGFAGSAEQCYGLTIPSGFVLVSNNSGADCDDTNGEVNSNHVEVLGNEIDDNCDGTNNEVAPLSNLLASHCGTTLAHISNSLFAVQVPSAQGYRFEISINGNNPRYFDASTNHFSLLNIPGGVLYSTTYTVRVAVKTNDFWRAYSTTCLVTTPPIPAKTFVSPAQCGTTVASMSTTIFAVQATAANQYRFEVSDGVSAARTYDSAVNRFSFAALGGLSYNTTYSVRVALRFGTTWEDYGTACNITTPATPPTSNVIPSLCGTTISNGWTTIYAMQVPEATGYRFNVTAPGVTRFYDTPNNRFSLRNIASFTVTPNTTYTITVQILYNGFYQTAGSACTITTAGVVTRQAETAVSIFDVKAYPNPYADTFKLDMNTSGEDTVEVKVYDMIGRQMEATILNVSDLDTKEIGVQYPSGVYNIIVTQGENVKTLRVIKR